jgi:hypothetical protein
MKRLALMILVFAALGAAQTKPEILTIPEGAVEIAPYTWRYTDAAGKKWLYKRTPFGVSRYEDLGQSTAATPKPRPNPNMKVTLKGEVVHFENPTPFGVQKWSRKKSELNEIEQLAYDHFIGAGRGSGAAPEPDPAAAAPAKASGKLTIAPPQVKPAPGEKK